MSRVARASTSSSTLHSTSFAPLSSFQQDASLDELTWSSSLLTWRKNGSTFRTFSYADLGHTERIVDALFVDFDVPSPSSFSPTSSSNDEKSALFGPFHRPAPAPWTDDVLSLPSQPPPSSPPLKTKPQRTLLVFLSTLAFAYPLKEGGRVPIPLPFRVKRAWSIEGGACVEREREGREVWAEGEKGEAGEGRVSTLWSLKGALEEMKPVALCEALGKGKEGTEAGVGQKPMRDLDERVVFTSSPAPSSSSPAVSSLLITAHPPTSTVRIYTYSTLSPSFSTLAYTPPPSSSYSRSIPRVPNPFFTGGNDPPSSSPTVTRRNFAAPQPSSANPSSSSTALPPSAEMSRTRGSLSGTKRKHSPSRSGSSSQPHSPAHPFFSQPQAQPALLPSHTSDSPHASLPTREELERSFLRRSFTSASAAGDHPVSLPGRPRPSLPPSLRAPTQGEEASLLDALVVASGGDGSFSFDGPEAGTSAAAAAAASLRVKRSGPERRISLARTNELSVTMDRMALSQGSSVGLPTTALAETLSRERDREWAWGELEREATVFVGEREALGLAGGVGDGEGEDGRRAEVGLEVVWEGVVDEGGGGRGLDGATAHLFDVRSTSSPTTSPCQPSSYAATLALHLPATSSLLLFSLSSTPSSPSSPSSPKLVATPVRRLSFPVLACASVLATRKRTGVQDLLVFRSGSEEGEDKAVLLTAGGAEVPYPLLNQVQGLGEVVKVDGSGGESVVLTAKDGSRRVVDLASPSTTEEDELAEQVLETLAQVLDTGDFGGLLRAVLENEKRKEWKWEKVEQTLREVFGDGDGKGKEREREKAKEAEEEDPFEAFLRLSSFSSEGNAADPVLALLRTPSLPASPLPSASPQAAEPVQPSPQQLSLLLALHLLVQDLSLSSSPSSLSARKKLGALVGRSASRMGLEGWTDAYAREGLLDFSSSLSASPPAPPPLSPSFPQTPPALLPFLSTLLTSPTPLVLQTAKTAFSLSSIPSLVSPEAPFEQSGFYGPLSKPLRRSEAVLELYALLSSPSSASSSTTTFRAHATVARLFTLSQSSSSSSSAPTSFLLHDLNFAAALPLREAVRMSQIDPPEPGTAAGAGWEKGTYEMVGRKDLARQLVGAGVGDGEEGEEMGRIEGGGGAGGGRKAIDRIVREAVGLKGEAVAGGEKKEAEGAEGGRRDGVVLVPKAERFNEDKRLEEVERMLQFEVPVVVSAGERTIDQLTPQIQQSILLALSQRTLSLPIGHAMFTFRFRPSPSFSSSQTSSTASCSSTETFAIPHLTTSARILPMSSPVSLLEKEPRDPANPSAVPDRLEWPDFHAGVSAALALRFPSSSSPSSSAKDGPALDASQLSFARPAELDARHAGLLFGLGLTGQLSQMLSSQAYDYLRAKHDPTSVGLLLGLAANYLGTGDATVTSVVSIHLPALHPPRSSSLNVSGMIQASAAVALGLVHFGTGRRGYAEVFLRELGKVRVENVEEAGRCREAYALSCGFGFGMVMLGTGRAAAGAGGEKDGPGGTADEVNHLRLFRTLIHSIQGGSSFSSGGGGNASIDTSITSPAATVALALTYLRSSRRDVAALLSLPDTPRGLDYVRHDLLLLRTIARSLILWSDIQKSKDWVEAQLPAFLRDAANEAAKKGKAMDGDLEVARWSIVAGACFAVGLRFAGTAAAEAHATLIHYLDRLTRASYAKTSTVQGKIKRHALRSSLGALTLALSMVMAGTGEINVLRRLRVAHGLFSEGTTYGSHLSTHMALGLLFVGKGQYTLGNSDAAVAALLIALYPAFPANSTENRAHLQAFRHLWVLAVEPRYLEARDVDTGERIFLPVKLRLVDQGGNDSSNPASSSSAPATKHDLRAKQLVAPTLIPDLAQIESIQVDSPRYWSFALRLSSNPQHLARFLSSPVLHVKRRTGHLSYAQDPRGIRSIFTRSKSETGSSVFDLGEMGRMLSPNAGGLKDFVAAFSGSDVEALAATRELCYAGNGRLPSEFEAFNASALLECLTKDKRDVVGTYQAIYAAATSLDVEAFSWAGTTSKTADLLLAAAQLQFVIDFYKNGGFKTLFSKPKPGSSKSSSSSSSSSQQVSREPLLSPSFVDHLSLRLASLTSALLGTEEPATALRGYLSPPGFPSPSPSSSASFTSTLPALSYLLTALRFPDLPVLTQLQHLVLTTAAEQPLGREEVAVLLRAGGRKISEQQRGIGGEEGEGEGGAGKKKRGEKAKVTGGTTSAWESEAEKCMVECWVREG
ncbi:hypothetical protein JCM8547_006981 [Rhodosporidiobolus lusitaniae]